jgi:hypothetical protein
MTCHMQIWVGAFVLDALGPSGSHAVRAHLTICEGCRDDVVSLWLASGMRGLLDADEPVVPSTQRHAAPEVRRCVRMVARAVSSVSATVCRYFSDGDMHFRFTLECPKGCCAVPAVGPG